MPSAAIFFLVGVSVALFACAWPLEITDMHDHAHQADAKNGESKPTQPNWRDTDDEFWRLVKRAWGVRRATLCTLPFFSDFCTGAGHSLACGGTAVHGNSWYNMSMQQPQPDLTFKGQPPAGFKATLCSEVAFSGDTSVHLAGPVAGPTCLRLFRAAVPMPPEGLRARLTVAVGGGVALRLCLRIRRMIRPSATGSPEGSRGREGSEAVVELGSGTDPRVSGTPFLPTATFKAASRATEVPFGPHAPLGSGPKPQAWTTMEFTVLPSDLPKWAQRPGEAALTSLDVVLAPRLPGGACQCNSFIGGVAVWSATVPLPACLPVKALTAQDVTVDIVEKPDGSEEATLAAVLTWIPPPGVHQCHVWLRVGISKQSESPQQGPGSSTTRAGGAENRGVKSGVVWGAAEWLGVACGQGFVVHGVTLPKGAVGAKLSVASAAAGGMQLLREASTVTIDVRNGMG